MIYTPADGVTAERLLGDGRLQVTFRQSGMNTLSDCLERGRLLASQPKSDKSSDAAAIGTAVHVGIQRALDELVVFGDVCDYDVVVGWAQAEFDGMVDADQIEWVKYTPDQAEAFIRKATSVWYDEFYPLCRPVAMEVHFDPLVIYEDDKYVIRITGTIDYVDERMGLIDWKTSGRKWQAWEAQRWYNQPTIYRMAAVRLGLVKNHNFTYIILYPSGGWDRITVTRYLGHSEWMLNKMLAITALIEAELPVWPMTDDHALCSEDWCPVWDQCKGKFMPDDWRRRSAYEIGEISGSSSLIVLTKDKPTGEET